MHSLYAPPKRKHQYDSMSTALYNTVRQCLANLKPTRGDIDIALSNDISGSGGG